VDRSIFEKELATCETSVPVNSPFEKNTANILNPKTALKF